MAALDRARIGSIAGWLALAYFLAFALPFLREVFVDGDGGALLGVFIGAPWVTAPGLVAAGLAAASPTRFGAAFFLFVELALIGWTGWFTYETMTYGNSTAPIAFIFLPLPQVAVIIVAFVVALTFGWRMRPDFLKD